MGSSGEKGENVVLPESSWVILPFWFPVSYDDQTYGIVLTKNEEHTRKSARKRKA